MFIEKIENMASNQPYSRIDQIPKGRAKGAMLDYCLVLEGGAFRGLYTQGVLDALMLNEINASAVIGVSAGALAAINYVSGQIGRSARINLTYRHNSEYVGLKALRKCRSPLNIDFLFSNKVISEELDRLAFDNSSVRLTVVTTNCLTGQTEYFEKGKCKDFYSAVKASASMPYLSPMISIEGTPHLDGGCSCNIPYQWALDGNYRKIIVVKTRDRSFRKEIGTISKVPERIYRNHPEFAKRLEIKEIEYNRECDAVDELEKQSRVFVLAPSEEVTVDRLESDLEKLGDLYWLGFNDTVEKLADIKDYLLS